MFNGLAIFNCTALASLGMLISGSVSATMIENPLDSRPIHKKITTNYRELFNLDHSVQPYTIDDLGEEFSPATGSVTFRQTDINIPGNSSLPVNLTRVFVGSDSFDSNTRDFGTWGIDIPHVRANMISLKDKKSFTGSWGTGKACSGKLGDVGEFTDKNRNPYYDQNLQVEKGQSFWNGDNIYIPNQGSTKIINKSGTSGVKTTNQQWKIECTFAPGGYEGFKITTLDGTIYTFNQLKMVKGKILNLVEERASSKKISPPFEIYHAFLLATKVEDKFGNTVEYKYDSQGKLISIEGNEGKSSVSSRKITLTYYSSGPFKNLVATASANGKTWNYSYTQQGGLSYVLNEQINALSKVTLPDNRSWSFKHPKTTDWIKAYLGLHTFTVPSEERNPNWKACEYFIVKGTLIDIEHPSGFKATYSYKNRSFNRANVELRILKPDFDTQWDSVLIEAQTCSLAYVLDNKTVTYSDNESYTWNYGYINASGYFHNDKKPSESRRASWKFGTLPYGLKPYDLKTTVVTTPGGEKVAHHHSAKWGWTENLPILIDYLGKDGTLPPLRRVISTKDKSTLRGNSLVKNDFTSGFFMRPKSQVTIDTFEDGSKDNFEFNHLTFNEYDAPTKTQESGPSGSKFVKRTYRHDVAHHAFNLLESVSISSNDETYKKTQEVNYGDFTAADNSYRNLKLVKEIYDNGRLTQTFKKYTNEGNVAEIEFNQNLWPKSSNEKRYFKRSDFKRGIARKVTIPSRLSATGAIHAAIEVNDDGLVTKQTDFSGVSTSSSYDSVGRILSIDLENDSADKSWLDTRFVWDDVNNTRTIKRCTLNQDNQCNEARPLVETIETYDSLLRLTQTKTIDNTINADAKSRVRYQNFEYDYKNRQTLVSFVSTDSTELNGTSTTYDALGRTKTVSVSGLGATKHAYLASNKVKVTDPLKNVTTTTYQAFGAPEYKIATFIDSPEEVDTSIAVNLFGQVEAITQSGPSNDGTTVSAVEKRVYDTNQQLCVITRPDVGNTIFGHNALGQLIWKKEGVSDTDCVATKPADAIEYVYDNVGDLHKINYPENSNTPSVTYTRDNNGNLTGLAAGDVTHRYAYNNQDLLEAEQLLINGQLHLEVGYGYNALQQRSYLAYPDGTVVRYSPNGFGEPTRAVTYKEGTEQIELQFATDARYYANGMLESFTYGNGVKHSLTLDKTSLLPDVLQDSRGTTNLVKLDYNFDNAGNVTSILDWVQPDYNLSLSYDGLHRLTSVKGGKAIGNSTIAYDALGNIESYTSKDRNLTYTYDRQTNRLSSVTGAGTNGKYANLAYDTRGNITNNGAYQLSFNLANQLTSAKNNTYLYDGHNRRVKQVEQSGTSYSLYSQDGNLLYREKGNTITGEGVNYIYLGKKLIAKYGDVTPTSEADSRQHYRPFGETLEQAKDDVGYTGHKFDKELGLSYMQARYYDPVIGRFYSNDPVNTIGHFSQGNIHGFNRYAYANNNPYKYTDPDGKFAIPLLFTPPALAAMGKAAAFVGSAAAAAWAGSEAINAYNESADPVEGILDGATEGEKTKGRTKNFDKQGGMDQANSDFDDVVDPDSVETITDGKGGEGRRGTVNDGSGRKVNVRPNSTDGRPTVEVQDGKNKTKIRYDEEKS